jgi:hypothetical protein
MIWEYPAMLKRLTIWFEVATVPPFGTRLTVTVLFADPVLLNTICFTTPVVPEGTVYAGVTVVVSNAGPENLLGVNTATESLSDKSTKRIAYLFKYVRFTYSRARIFPGWRN